MSNAQCLASSVHWPLFQMENTSHLADKIRVREEKPFHRASGTESLALNRLAGQKCCALLIKSNVIQFHYTRPEMCALHIYISRLARSLRPVSFVSLSHFGPPFPSVLLHLSARTLSRLCHLYLFYFHAGSALRMWPTGKVTTKVN